MMPLALILSPDDPAAPFVYAIARAAGEHAEALGFAMELGEYVGAEYALGLVRAACALEASVSLRPAIYRADSRYHRGMFFSDESLLEIQSAPAKLADSPLLDAAIDHRELLVGTLYELAAFEILREAEQLRAQERRKHLEAA